MLHLTTRKYNVIIEVESDTAQKGIEEIEKTIGVWGFKVLDCKHLPNTRSEKQSRSLHKYLTMYAELFTEHGIDMKMILKPHIPIPATMYLLKELLWKPTQKKLFGKNSTKELTTKDIDLIVDVITRAFGTKFGLYVPWPTEKEKKKL